MDERYSRRGRWLDNAVSRLGAYSRRALIEALRYPFWEKKVTTISLKLFLIMTGIARIESIQKLSRMNTGARNSIELLELRME